MATRAPKLSYDYAVPDTGASIASAATITPGAETIYPVTGTTQINTITADATTAGRALVLTFASALTIGTSGNIGTPFGAAMSVLAGETVIFIQSSATAWKVVARSSMLGGESPTITTPTITSPTITKDASSTNTTETVATLRRTSSGTPATNIGGSLDLEVETASGNNEIGARIAAVATDVTGASEDFALDFLLMAAGAAAARVLRLSSVGEMLPANIHNNGGTGNASNQSIASGTYTPSATGTANVTTVTPSVCQWTRVGNTVILSGEITVDPAVAGTLTTFRITLPIASDFANNSEAGGYAWNVNFGANTGTAWSPGVVQPDTTNNQLQFAFFPDDGTSRPMNFMAHYLVI